MDIVFFNMSNRIDAKKDSNEIFLLTPPQHDEIAGFEQEKEHLTSAWTAKLLDQYNEILEIITKQVWDKIQPDLV